MTSLQIGLIIGGVVLVVGVLIYNWMQERRVRRNVAATSDRRERRRTGSARRRADRTYARTRRIE